MRFFISKKADVCFLQQLQQDAWRFGANGLGAAVRQVTIFTDEPLERRRKLEVTIGVSTALADILAQLTSPFETDISLQYDPTERARSARYEFELTGDDENLIEFLLQPVGVPAAIAA